VPGAGCLPQWLLGVAALAMAVWKRRPDVGLIHHSDHGCQDTSLLFGQRCQDLGIQCSMGSVGDCFDNAMVERFFATLECELLVQHRFQTPDEAPAAVFEWLEVFDHRQRRHSALGYQSPAVDEPTDATHTPSVA
jgi:putative transposase